MYTNMKIKIKLDLYVLKEYFTGTLCGKKKNVGESLSKSSEMEVEMRKGSLTKFQINTGCDHLQHEGPPGIVGT